MSHVTVSKAKQCSGAVMSLFFKSETTNWASKMMLYDSLVLGSLQHCMCVWAISYTDLVERVQVAFFKRLLGASRSTPDCLVRLETGSVHLAYTVFKNSLSWLLNILSMTHARYPLLCFNRLLSLSQSFPDSPNWCVQLRSYFEKIDALEIWENLSFENLRRNRTFLLNKFQSYLRQSDIEALRISRYSSLYNSLILQDEVQSYLKMHMPSHVMKILAKIRLSGVKFLKFSYNGCLYTVNCSEICLICNCHQLETFDHVMFECPIYEPIRNKYMPNISNANVLAAALSGNDLSLLKGIAIYVINSMLLRSFVLSE